MSGTVWAATVDNITGTLRSPVRLTEQNHTPIFCKTSCFLFFFDFNFVINNKCTINTTKVHITTSTLCNLHCYMFRHFSYHPQFTTKALIKLHMFFKLQLLIQFIKMRCFIQAYVSFQIVIVEITFLSNYYVTTDCVCVCVCVCVNIYTHTHTHI